MSRRKGTQTPSPPAVPDRDDRPESARDGGGLSGASRLHAIVRGRVQGVGFRDATWREARSLRLRGWVRNRLDGTVEVTAAGPRPALRRLEIFLRQGPPMANVTGADIFWEAAPESSGDDPVAERPAEPDKSDSFQIRP